MYWSFCCEGRYIPRFVHIFGQIVYFQNSASNFISSGKFRLYSAYLSIFKLKNCNKIPYNKHKMRVLFFVAEGFLEEN